MCGHVGNIKNDKILQISVILLKKNNTRLNFVSIRYDTYVMMMMIFFYDDNVINNNNNNVK